MTTEQPLNAWGEPVEPEDPTDEYWVPPEERQDDDSGPGSNALGPDQDGVDTGDDVSDDAGEE